MKKFVLVITSCILTLLICTATYSETDIAVYPIVDEPYELDIWCVLAPTIEDMNTNETTHWYEEKTGVHVNWTQVTRTDAVTKLNLSLSSGDYPDIYSAEFSTDQVTQYSQAGIFIALDDLIEKYGVNIKKAFSEHPEIRPSITATDGHIYTLFRTDPATYVLVRNKLYVNHDWTLKYLKETGCSMPETYKEFEDMLIYWRDHDMNENGDPSDEIPMMGTFDASGGDFTVYLMNAFQATPEYNESFPQPRFFSKLSAQVQLETFIDFQNII